MSVLLTSSQCSEQQGYGPGPLFWFSRPGTTSGGDSLVCLSGRAVTVTATFTLTTEIQSSSNFFLDFQFSEKKKKFKKKSNFTEPRRTLPILILGATVIVTIVLCRSHPGWSCTQVHPSSGPSTARSILLGFTSYHSCRCCDLGGSCDR